ncbi:MAG: hypothetical protein V2I50_14005 [Desulfuromusa sp.]|jgi:hypothetical protein|nr:hypothetical protein [Desulfuromusa sp.]
MSVTQKKIMPIDPLNRKSYIIETLEDEIKADNNCKVLLQQFHSYLLKDKNIIPIEAGSMASGTDYFLRDFMIDNRRTNIFDISPDLVRSFAGNWYITSTLEPNMTELESILTGISHFYIFCAEKKTVNPELAEKVHQACTHTDYYQQRIESFHNISGDGYIVWNSECPLQTRGRLC